MGLPPIRYAPWLSRVLVAVAVILAVWGMAVAGGWMTRPTDNTTVLLFGSLAAFELAFLPPRP